MKRLLTLLSILGFACFGGLCIYASDSLISILPTEIGKVYKTTSFSRTSVHDPSIVVDNSGTKKKYYIYGSHRASAVTSDLKNWSWNNWTYGIQNTAGTVSTVDYTKAFLTNMTKTVKVIQDGDIVDVAFGNFDCLQWRYTSTNADLAGNQWAPDVIWNPYMEKWCLYMSLNGDNWRSSIVLMTSDKITGPYVYQGPVTFSGFHWTDLAEQTWKQTDLTLAPGLESITAIPDRYNVGKSWGNRWPNDIDPCVFFDDDGQMWMSYGSWSGGIFMLRLDRMTGLRDYTVTYRTTGSGDNYSSDAYFGKKIAGGCYVSGEGSYIEKIGKYYYLFMSYGGLNSDGGYEMRYFRSENPDGPYKDVKGTSAVFTTYQMNYGTKANSNAGTRLFGSYKWTSMEDAEVAQGHNSALYDDDGRAYLIYHTRFANGGEGHQVRVHQLFQNASGWLLAAPYEFYDCKYNQDSIESRQLCSAEEIAGTYQMILHKYKLDYANKAYQSESQIVLTEDGKVTGDYTGTWRISRDSTSYITLSLAPGGSSVRTVYTGVVLPQPVSGTNMKSVSFMALCTSATYANCGVAIWGTNIDGKAVVDCNYQKLKSEYFDKGIPAKAFQLIESDIDFSTIPTLYGAELTWSSDRPDIIGDDGKLMITPSSDTSDPKINVQLTCRIKKDGYYYDFKRTVRVRTSEPDAINGVVSDDSVRARFSDGVYTLSGTRIADSPDAVCGMKGIFIYQGKKFMAK